MHSIIAVRFSVAALSGALALAGCAGGSAGSAPANNVSSVPPPTGALIAVLRSGSVDVFAGGPSAGSARTSLLPPRSFQVESIALRSDGALYTGMDYIQSHSGPNSINGYEPGASSLEVPLSKIPVYQPAYPFAVDAAGDVFINGYVSIVVYPKGATQPSYLPAPGSHGPIACDRAGNVAITDPARASVIVYPAASSPTSSATRTISGALTTLGNIQQLAFSADGTLYVLNAPAGSATYVVDVFRGDAEGNTAPVRVLNGPFAATPGFYAPTPPLFTVDGTGEIIVGISDDVQTTFSLYPAGASGSASPVRTFVTSRALAVVAN